MPGTPWEAGEGLVTAAGLLCLPLLLDPEIARELVTHTLSGAFRGQAVVVQSAGRRFIPTLHLPSLAAASEALWPEAYREVRQALLRELDLWPEASPILDDKLAAIVFGVLPHFVRLTPPGARGPFRPQEVLRALSRRLSVPPRYAEQARRCASPEELARRLRILEAHDGPPPPPPQGLVTGAMLDAWLKQSWRARIIRQERQTLARRLEGDPGAGEDRLAPTALLLYLAETGTLEVEGFGFSRLSRNPPEYRIYRHTGAYALKDYYGRPYLFPDCRVAVSTRERLRPLVLDRYKHPFLRWHAPGQEICLPQEYQPPLAVGADQIIAALEAGLNALFYGYNPRRRNGYHSLDRLHQEQLISFQDYLIPPDDPRLVSGEVEVKNHFA
jgi:hypothetical protein